MRRTRLAVLALCFVHSVTQAANCNGLWQKFDSNPYVANLFIDTSNTYWKLKFQVPAKGTTAFKVTGKFPFSRYLNFTVYDQQSMDATSAISDYGVQPDDGSFNPFWEGADLQLSDRNYTLYLVPSGTKSKFPFESNVLEYPKPTAGTQYVEIWYRVYFPNRGSDANGNVPLPNLEAFDVKTLSATTCPSAGSVPPPTSLSMANLPPNPYAHTIYFYRAPGEAIYSDLDNHYLVSRLTHRKSDVYVFRFRAPSHSETYAGTGNFNATTEVRYWSLCVAGADGITGECLPDSKAQEASDGFINVVVGSEDLREDVEALGLNFISRGDFSFPVVLYRNLLTASTFEGSALNVPIWTPSGVLGSGPAASEYTADQYIGDYAPLGRYCSTRRFFKNYCEVPVSF